MPKKTRRAVSRSPKKSVKKVTVSKNALGLSPSYDRVFLTPLEDKGEGQTASGIYIPESGKDNGVKRGKVAASGPGKWDNGIFHPVSVAVGDTVLYQWGEKVTIKGIEYVVVRDSEILAVEK